MKRQEELITEINIIPLVDIILVILIIFLIVAQVLGPSVFKVKLPEASNAEMSKEMPVTIWLDKDGRIALNGYGVSEEELMESIKKLVESNKDLQVILSADEGVYYGDAVRMLDKIRGEGVRKIAIQVQPK